jgi:hypothetical protein
MLKKEVGGAWIWFPFLRIRRSGGEGGSSEHGDEPSPFIKFEYTFFLLFEKILASQERLRYMELII